MSPKSTHLFLPTRGEVASKRGLKGRGASRRRGPLVASAIALLSLSACTLAPRYERPAAPVAAEWPVPTATSDARLHWRELFTDPALQATITAALDNNRDLRAAAATMERARAQYGITGAPFLPSFNAGIGESVSQPAGGTEQTNYTASLGMSAWEIDLFGRIRSLKASAVQSFFAAEENRNAVTLSLIAATAQQWLTLAADQDLAALTRQTLIVRKDALDIAEGRARIGVLNDLDLNQIRGLYETARADAAAADTRVDQDKAALTLLAGRPLDASMLPSGLNDTQVASALPVGLPSDVLLDRPDVLSAEHSLQAANANIGAARAAFFPRITLTGSLGGASPDLGSLFDSASQTYSFSPQISVPIFAGGANVAGLNSARASRDLALAQYEKAIQSAFSEVSQALIVRARIDERLDAQTKATTAAQTATTLATARYNAGTDSYLTLLDSQRTLYASQQALISLRALRATNLVALYKALGDDGSL